MANRRMFSKSITNSSIFIMMPPTSRLLYYDLGMNADDDGFCEHFVVMKMTDATPDDLRILKARGLVEVFDERVLIVLNWKENNYIQKDRYTPSKYLKIYKEEMKLLVDSGKLMDTKCIQSGYTGKDRLGKVKREAISSLNKKPFYEGKEMRRSKGKWWVLPDDGSKWLEFAGKESDITWK